MLKGETVILYEKTETGRDIFGKPVYEESPVSVKNVLIAPAQEQEVVDDVNISGRKAVYVLGIPKTDDHNWEDKIVEFWGTKWHTVGKPVRGIDAMIPLKWNMKVRVEKYVY